MRLYRVEDEYGDGVYNCEVGYPEGFDGRGDTKRHPHPRYDSGLLAALGCDSWDAVVISSGWGETEPAPNSPLRHWDDLRFAFASIAQFKFWFHRKAWRSYYDRNGLRLVEYEVAAGFTFCGDTQAIFDREHARVVKRHLLSSV